MTFHKVVEEVIVRGGEILNIGGGFNREYKGEIVYTKERNEQDEKRSFKASIDPNESEPAEIRAIKETLDK